MSRALRAGNCQVILGDHFSSGALSMEVTIGRRDRASALLYVPGTANTRLLLGFAPYFQWSVLYDNEHYHIGLKKRSLAAATVDWWT